MRSRSIKALFLLTMAGLGVLCAGMGTLALVDQVAAYRKAQSGAILSNIYGETVKAVQAALVERAVTIALLGLNQVPDEATRAPMLKARAADDAVIVALRDRIVASNTDGDGAMGRAVDLATAHFAEMRAKVDARLNRPVTLRTPQEWADAANASVTSVDSFVGLLDTLEQNIAKTTPEALSLLSLARSVVTTRLMAGYLTTKLGPQLETNAPLSRAEIIDIAFVKGQVKALDDELLATIAKLVPGTEIDRAMRAAQESFFVQGIAMIDRLVAESEAGHPYDVRMAVYSPTIVGELNTMWPVRDAVLTLAGQSATARLDICRTKLSSMVLFLLLILAALAGAVLFFRQRLIAPLTSLTSLVTVMAGGMREVDVPYTARPDEIGELARGLRQFLEYGRTADRLAAEQMSEQAVKAERALRLATRLTSFEAEVSGLAEQISSASSELEGTARSMRATAAQTNSQVETVTEAAHRAGAGVQTAATASEQLAASIQEINRQMMESARITSKAVEDARRTDSIVRALSEGAQRIEQVIGLIAGIAGQTNLLALNATIEAARAGDAGKGFAVVASEVKNLALQTAKSTSEISGQIGEIQQVTRQAVEAIQAITISIETAGEIATTIGAALDRQGAATADIARNVQQTAVSTQDVTSHIVAVGNAASETGTASASVLEASVGLSRRARQLNDEMTRFIADIRAA